MSRICLYYRPVADADRWVRGDRHVRPLIRRLVRGKPRLSGVDRVFHNLCLGLDELRMAYEVNLPFKGLAPDDRVGVLGQGRHCLDGYDRPNPIVAGIGLFTYAAEWPDLCETYPVVTFLSHSEWVSATVRPWFGARCAEWPVGIETERWIPAASAAKHVDFLLYDKIHWEYERRDRELLEPIRSLLRAKGLSFEELRYGSYEPDDYRAALSRCRALIYLGEHESQGIAVQEAMSSGVPVLAWDQGWYLDPDRLRWGLPECVPATSVPYFDERCGVRFTGATDFPDRLDEFLDRLRGGRLAPRDYVLEHLTLARCSRHFVSFLDAARAA